MQALKLLKFVKGFTKVYTPWNPTDNGYYLWLITINEAGKPFNCTLGVYKKEMREPLGSYGYVTCYFLGKRWMKVLDKKK